MDSYDDEMERQRARRDFARQENERRERELEVKRRAEEQARLRFEARERELRAEYEHRKRIGTVFGMSYEEWKRHFNL